MVLIRNNSKKYGYNGPESIEIDERDQDLLIAAKELADQFQSGIDYIITPTKSSRIDLEMTIFPFPLVLGLKKEKKYRIYRVTMTSALYPVFPDIWKLDMLRELKVIIQSPFFPQMEHREKPLEKLIVKVEEDVGFDISTLGPVKKTVVKIKDGMCNINLHTIPETDELFFHWGGLIINNAHSVRKLKIEGALFLGHPLPNLEHVEFDGGWILTLLSPETAFPNLRTASVKIPYTTDPFFRNLVTMPQLEWSNFNGKQRGNPPSSA